MPRYYFDVKNGHRLIDPAGLECRDDQDAITQATFIAAQIAMDVPNTSGGRSVAVLNSVREEIIKVPINTNSKGDHHGGEQADRRQCPQGRGEKRTQRKSKVMGKPAWTKRDKKSGEFMAVKKSAKKFKGVRREKGS